MGYLKKIIIIAALSPGLSITSVGLAPFAAMAATPNPPTSADDCKDGGWESLTDGDGNAFPNQGQCISYYNSTQEDDDGDDGEEDDDVVTVTIVKYVDGERATGEETDNAEFDMSSEWDADNIGAGSGNFTLNDGNDYEAVTSEMSEGADYSTEEDLTGDTVGESCEDGTPYALDGYSIGGSLEEAEGAEMTDEVSLTDLTEDQYVIVWNMDCSDPTPETAHVSIHKYLDGEMATAETADSTDFPMSATWDAENIGAGTGGYTLSETGSNSPDPYTAMTVELTKGADYSTEEVMGEIVAESCEGDAPYALAGYTTGSTLEEAEEGEMMDEASFTDLQDDQHVIVWNESCDDGDDDDGVVTVTIMKYIDGEMATTDSADGISFPMSATWSDLAEGGIGAGTGNYDLDEDGFNGDPTPYQAITAEMQPGANYSTNEILTGDDVGATCEEDKPFALEGYTTGSTLEDAENATPSLTIPAFTNLQDDMFVIVWNMDCTDPTPETANVTIVKYLDGEEATAEEADSTDFPMTSTWDAENIGAGSGSYTLSENGFNTAEPYRAMTVEMTKGADYSTQETMGEIVGDDCDEDGTPYVLEGYTTGNTLAAAAAGTPTMTIPSFTDLQDDMFVIVWNEDCDDQQNPDTAHVTILKYIEGSQATASSGDSLEFPMSATWNDMGEGGIGSGTGTFTLGPSNNPNDYQTQTIDFQIGANYSTNETLTGDNVGASCDEDKPFALIGYTTGNTLTEAQNGTPTSTAPSFTNLQQNKYVIVWNDDCDIENNDGELQVTSIDAIDTSSNAEGTYEDGWEYVFHITAPSDEQNLQMKFSDWLRTGGGGTIPVANNMRISSAQADNGGATITLTAADTYSTPPLHMTGDLNPGMAGRQVDVTVEVKIPVGTPNGTYTTNYGVKTTP